jgi:cell division protein FtsQ
LKTGTTIKKILFVAVWIVIGGGMFTLLMAAISRKNRGVCRDYVITVNQGAANSFTTPEEVAVLLEELVGGPVKGQPVASFRLGEMEQQLEQDEWIDEAELYLDNRDVLHVTVREKIPVARVFTTSGQTFYTDSTGDIMPVSAKKAARVPVFTGFPGKQRLSEKDSVLLKQVASTASFILSDAFWRAQVSQIEILPDRSFEMIPLVGDHRVKLGDGEQIAEKFRRLYIFYVQVLAKTGLNAYRQIDVQYKGQVVASRFSGAGKTDSVQLRRNVEKLLRKSKEPVADTVNSARPRPTRPLEADEKPVTKPALPLEENKDPNPVKTTSVSPDTPEKEPRRPKAVMPKRDGEQDDEQEQ